MGPIFSCQKLLPFLLADWTDLEVDTLIGSARSLAGLQTACPVHWLSLQWLLHSNLEYCKLQTELLCKKCKMN